MGVPYVPFFIGAGGCMLLAMYFDLLFLALIPVVIFIMRMMAKRDLFGIECHDLGGDRLTRDVRLGDQPIDRRDELLVAGRWNGLLHRYVSFETHRP